jgi:hypothetical protein
MVAGSVTRSRLARRLPTGLATVLLALSSGIALSPRSAGAVLPPPATFTANVRADQGRGAAGLGDNEPAVVVDQAGKTYVSWQQAAGVPSWQASTLDGTSFSTPVAPDPASLTGDVAFATTTFPTPGTDRVIGSRGESGVFFAMLGAGKCGAIEIREATSVDQGATWDPKDAVCQPAQVDRPWIAAYTPPQYRGTADAVAHTMVYTEHHDFGASNIWVTSSSDGGKTWNLVPVNAEQAGTPAQFVSLCNSIPGGIAVAQRGPHAGRVYAVWETSDPVFYNLSGCNYTQAQPFDHIFVSYSDDQGATWTSRNVYNDPCAPNPPSPPAYSIAANPAIPGSSLIVSSCNDTSELFNSVAVDDGGNVYVAFVARTIPGTTTTRIPSEYDVYVSRSTDGGDHWNGSTTGNAGPPHRVNTGLGTHYMPWVVAGQDGALDIVFFATSAVAPVSGFFNKPVGTGTTATWHVYMSQSFDHGTSFTQDLVDDAGPNGIYFGDICSTGIFCGGAPPGSGWGNDRTLYDVFGAAIGPDGALRTAWTDARDTMTGSCKPGAADQSCEGGPGVKTRVYFACQKTGMTLYGTTLTGSCPRGTATNFPAVSTVTSPSPGSRTLPNTSRTSPVPVTRLGAWTGLRDIAAPAVLAVLVMALVVVAAWRGREDPGRR